MLWTLYFFSVSHLWSTSSMAQAAPDSDLKENLTATSEFLNMTNARELEANEFGTEIIELEPSMASPLSRDEKPDRFDDFFWSGSGDGEDGVTYWITTTVYRTATITFTLTYRPSPRFVPNSPSLASEFPVAPSETWLEEDETFVLCSPTPTQSLDIEPTPTFTVSVNPTPVWPTNSSLWSKWSVPSLEYWIRTVVRTNMSESSPEFHEVMEARLNRVYRHAFAAILKKKRETVQNRTKRAESSRDVQVLIHNITRPAKEMSDVHMLYSLYDKNETKFILATEAVERLRRRISESQVTMDLCTHPDASAVDLCKLVLIKAEPYLAYTRASSGKLSSWLIAVIVIVVVVAVMLLVLVGFLTRKNLKKSQRIAQQSLGNRAFQVETPVRRVEKGTQITMETPKFGATDLKHVEQTEVKRPKRGQRPRTAPARRESMSPTGSERTEFRKCCQEPNKPSRGVRGVKRKSRNKRRQEESPNNSTDSSDSAEEVGHSNPTFLQVPEVDILPSKPVSARGKHKRVSITNLDVSEPIEQGTRTPPMTSPTGEAVRPRSGILKVKSGSLIPTRVSSAVFGRRETTTVMVENLRPASAEEMPVTRSPRYVSHAAQSAWASSEPSIGDLHCSETQLIARNELDYQEPFVGGLHVHAQSYPEWPHLPPSDPAIDLINSIKEELKKFDSEC